MVDYIDSVILVKESYVGSVESYVYNVHGLRVVTVFLCSMVLSDAPRGKQLSITNCINNTK